ncbi:MAG: hypothetical protein LBU70_08155 [Chitinispirillales bacterium]|jgi:hypothetical protein|nr:hypothetical protein [Chitinispirillales bacterium]
MKKHLLRAFVCIGVLALTLLIACGSGAEAAGDKAYKMSQRTTGAAQREHWKMAFMKYREAVMANPQNVSTRLRNRFIEMCIVRARLMLEEGGVNMGGIPLLMNDIEAQLKDDVETSVRQDYARFLAQLGDSSSVRRRFIDALRYYDRAISKAADPAPFREMRAGVIGDVVQENYEIAKFELAAGRREKEEEDKTTHFIRAEYFAKVALYFDSTFVPAQTVLGEIYKENIWSYSAFVSVIRDYTDTVMFRRINDKRILLAIAANPSGGTRYEIRVHSSANTDLRMRSEHFALIDLEGKRFNGAPGANMSPDILGFEREGVYTINFPGAPAMGRISKLIYDNTPQRQFSEKYFQ